MTEIVNPKEIPSFRNRVRFGENLSNQLEYQLIVFVGNVPHAVPEIARPELTKHSGVPPSTYAGRTPAIATSYVLEQSPTVVLQTPPFSAEVEVITQIAQQLGVNPPTVVTPNGHGEPSYKQKQLAEKLAIRPNDAFWHPFIASNEFGDINTFPDSQFFNNKAQMRKLMKDNGMTAYIPAGEEVFVEPDDTLETMTQKTIMAIKRTMTELNLPTVRIKLGNTASGLATHVIDQEMIDHPNLQQTIESLFFNPDLNGQNVILDDVVIEEEINFGNGDQYADFGIRGYVLPNGDVEFLSVGRVISEDKKFYKGMFMAAEENPSNIGLSLEKIREIKAVFNQFSELTSQYGYRGPVNVDIFVDLDGNTHLFHDFNMRDGGSSASSFFAYAINPLGSTLDCDIKLQTEKPMKPEFASELIHQLWKEHQVIVYATTFWQFPSQVNGATQYSTKIMAPVNQAIATDTIGLEQISRVIDNLNQIGVGKFSF